MVGLARSNEEAHLYLDLHPCACGGGDASRDSAVGLVDDAFVVRYSCVCGSCGTRREVEFRQPAEPARPAWGAFSAGPLPSEVIDAGQWLLVADRFGGAPAEPAGLAPQEAEQAHADLASAEAAIDEVLKFLPSTMDEVPADAFWTEQGRTVRDASPERFRRERLDAVRETFRRVRAGYER